MKSVNTTQLHTYNMMFNRNAGEAKAQILNNTILFEIF